MQLTSDQMIDRLLAVNLASQHLHRLYLPAELAQQIIHTLESILGYEYGAVLLIDPASQELLPFALSDQGQGVSFIAQDKLYVAQRGARVGLGITGWVAQHGKALRIGDVRQDPRYNAMRDDIRSELCVPMFRGDRVIGVLNVETTVENAYNELDQMVLETIASQIVIALENARLFEEVQRYAASQEMAVAKRTTELRHTLEQMRAILDNSPDPILLLDRNGCIQQINRRASHFFGHPEGTLLDREPSDFFHPSSREELGQSIQRTLHQGRSVRLAGIALHEDGQELDVDVALGPFWDGGRIMGAVCNIRDIRELKQLERMKDEFVANVTHELRTPLTNLKLRHFLLRRQPERMELHLDVLERETARLTATIDDLLRLSRLDQGRMTLEHRPIDLCALVAQHVLDRSMLAEMEAISLSTLFDPANPPPLPAILGDEGLLGQALSILLTNAITYTPAGGRVWVDVLHIRNGTGDWSGFRVQDTGPGILAEEQARIFQRFMRGSAGKQTDQSGTGLGLAILKAIVDRHNGRVEVSSAGVPGEGAAFTVWLPAIVG